MYKILSNDDLALVVGEKSEIIELYFDHCYTIKDFKERINRYKAFIYKTLEDYNISHFLIFWGSKGEPDLSISKSKITMHMDYDSELKAMCEEIRHELCESIKK